MLGVVPVTTIGVTPIIITGFSKDSYCKLQQAGKKETVFRVVVVINEDNKIFEAVLLEDGMR